MSTSVPNDHNSNIVDIAHKHRKHALNTIIIIFSVFIALFGGTYIAMTKAHLSVLYVSGESMEPAIKQNSLVVIQYDNVVTRGDIAVIKYPKRWAKTDESRDTYLIKRVVGVPGDHIQLNNTGLTINGEKKVDFADGSYTCERANTSPGLEDYAILGQSEIFVLGDNHKKSMDSLRTYCTYDEGATFLSAYDVAQTGKIVFTLPLVGLKK